MLVCEKIKFIYTYYTRRYKLIVTINITYIMFTIFYYLMFNVTTAVFKDENLISFKLSLTITKDLLNFISKIFF